MPWIQERVGQLIRSVQRLSTRPLDPELVETMDRLDLQLARWQRLARLRGLPKRPTRIPADASAVAARVARALRDEHPYLTLELQRPTSRRRVLLDAPAVELATRCLLELLLAHSASPQHLRIRVDVEGDAEAELELTIALDHAAELDAAPEEVALVEDGLARAGLEWVRGSTHRVRQRVEREEPITGRYVFPPPSGASR